ncbi:MAG: apolipoprotein N-acyltransferase [Chromatiaceae bacterium]
MYPLRPSPRLALRAFAATVAGGLAVLAFAPFGVYLIAVLALAVLYELLARSSPAGGFWVGWAFGIGLMGFGVFWIRISLNEFGNMGAPLAYGLTFLFILGMALYYGIVGWLMAGLAGRGPPWTGPLLLFPSLWVLGEWVRGWLFTGFPWLAVGYSQVDSPLAGLAPIAGVYGVSLAVALSAGLVWGAVHWQARDRVAALMALGALWLAGGVLLHLDWTHPAGRPLRATVVQANIRQSVKWDPESRISTLRAYVKMTRANWRSDIIVWPETAVPDFLNRVQRVFIDPLTTEAKNSRTELVIGIPVHDPTEHRYYNGLMSLGTIQDLYRKRHLVPFGEYMPFKSLLGPLAEAFEIPMSDFRAGRAGRPLLRVGHYLAGVSICYEDAFPGEVVEAMPDAAFFVNVSNDAWFGDSLAPPQHLEIARMRGLENERWTLRATNTGISAIMDAKGRIVGRVPAFERGVTTAQMQPRAGATPFAYAGDWLPIGAALGMLAGGLLLARRGAV